MTHELCCWRCGRPSGQSSTRRVVPMANSPESDVADMIAGMYLVAGNDRLDDPC